MKIYINRFRLILLLTILISFSCGDYLDVNEDPDNLKTNPGYYSIPSAQVSMASIIGGRFALAGAMWTQSYNQNNTANQYRRLINMDVNESDFDNSWQELYSGALADLKSLKEYSDKIDDPKLNLVATLLEVYIYQVLADAYGKVVYSEAIKGETGNFNPTFEDGFTVYPKLVSSIDNAKNKYLAHVKENPKDNEFPTALKNLDYIFNGVMDNWVKFANSLKLKLATRNYDYDKEWSLKIINELEKENNYLTIDAKLDIFAKERNKQNPLYAQDQNLNTTINIVANRTLYDFLKANGDIREEKFYVKNSDGDLILNHGNHGASTQSHPENSNRKVIHDAERPVYILTTSEIDFFRAELVVKNIITGNAKQLYDNAVKKAFTRVGVDESQANALLNSGGNYEFKNTNIDTSLIDIAVQKWVSLVNVNPIESFFEINRLNYPKISYTAIYKENLPSGNSNATLYLPPQSALGNTKYIKRLPLPESERQNNSKFPGLISVTEPLWWDIN